MIAVWSVLWVWMTGTAHASPIDVTFCVNIETKFSDSLPDVSVVLDDYLVNNATPRPMRGVSLEVALKTAPYTTVTQYTAYENGTLDAGCAKFQLVSTLSYTVKMLSSAQVRNHTINIFPDAGGPKQDKTLYSNYVVPGSNTRVDYALTGGFQSWSTLTLLAWALYHRDGGLSTETWTVYEDLCPEVAGAVCYSCDGDNDTNAHTLCGGTDSTDNPPAIYIGALDDRFTILHEFGHYLLAKRNEYQRADYPNGSPVSSEGCNHAAEGLHELQSKEVYAPAFSEGFGDFYAVMALNDGTDDDCFISYNKDQDFDKHNGVDNKDANFDRLPTNCKGNPGILNPNAVPPTWIGGNQLDAAISETDYLYDSNVTLECGCAYAGSGCSLPSPVMDNRATSLDFGRFWWWLYTEQGWSFSDIVDVMDLLDPQDWDGDDETLAYWLDQPVPYTISRLDYLEDNSYITQQMYDDWIDGMVLHGVDE